VAIIDRYEGVRRPCARYLEHFNFEVAEAPDPVSALSLVDGNPPALILLEDCDAADFVRLQEHAEALSIPCVSLSTALGYGDGMPDNVLVKPFTMGAMLDEIRRVLGEQMREPADNRTVAL
jgi:DNA-binding response OmpR family regulator